MKMLSLSCKMRLIEVCQLGKMNSKFPACKKETRFMHCKNQCIPPASENQLIRNRLTERCSKNSAEVGTLPFHS